MKQFYYMAFSGIHFLRLKQLTTLHHVASKLKYDSDVLYIIQAHLIKMNILPDPYNLRRVIELREIIVPRPIVESLCDEYEEWGCDPNKYRIPPDSWEDEYDEYDDYDDNL